jgi:hypothetical protein
MRYTITYDSVQYEIEFDTVPVSDEERARLLAQDEKLTH